MSWRRWLAIAMRPPVYVVNEKHVDAAELEALQTLLERRDGSLPAVVEDHLKVVGGDFARGWAEEPPHLAGDHEFVPVARRERGAEAQLAAAKAIERRRIEIANAALPRRIHRSARGGPGVRRIEVPDRPAAKTQFRHQDAGAPERPFPDLRRHRR